MALPGPSFLIALIVLSYLSTFVLFALLRIITGVSIQRIGWSGLRRIAFTPQDGIRIDIRGLGLTLHRPTFAQPTWFSIVLTELCITINPEALARTSSSQASQKLHHDGQDASSKRRSFHHPERSGSHQSEESRSRTWQRLTQIKEKLKGIHRKIRWIRLVDLVATGSSVVIVDVATVQIANVTLAVDTRRKTVDRSRLFQHKKHKSQSHHPAEWFFTLRSVLFTPEGRESTELLDHCTLNVHGLLHEDLDGLRDASVSLKLGRLNIPCDDLIESATEFKWLFESGRRSPTEEDNDYSFTEVGEEPEKPDSREDAIIRAVSDSKEFLSSILRGIQEVQFAFGFMGLSKQLRVVQPSGCPVYLNLSMKEVGLDLQRLDPRSPAHRMYFPPSDIAHQALMAAISISVGIDDGNDHPERIWYIPMATATMKTTLPAKTIQLSDGKNAAERNANILFANLVITSPSIDLDPKHLPLVFALFQQGEKVHASMAQKPAKPRLISQLLPKASIKFSVHEPVIRVSLPSVGTGTTDDDFDLLISSMSSMSLDIESSHSADGEFHYALGADLRLTSHELYYQKASREKHNLLLTDTLELKTQLTASPDVAVVATGHFHTFSVYMVRDEISEGLRQIIAQLRSDLGHQPTVITPKSRESFLRKLPLWLKHVKLQGSDFNIEVAGLDTKVSPHARGCAFQLESWTAEYKADKSEDVAPYRPRRRVSERYSKENDLGQPGSPPNTRRRQGSLTDGRRLAVHVQGLEGFVLDYPDASDPESFLSLPRFEVAFTSSTDSQGPVFHINALAKYVYLQYSLSRHYAIGVALVMLKKTFAARSKFGSRLSTPPLPRRSLSSDQIFGSDLDTFDQDNSRSIGNEITTVDFKATLLQIKAFMPTDPPLMLQVSGLSAGLHRWAPPFGRAGLARLYTKTPANRAAWSRILSVKGVRADYRRSRRKSGMSFTEDKSIDFSADAARIAVPHQLIVHKVFDNIANVVKTVKWLHHRLETDSDVCFSEKEPERPRKVPKVSLRCAAFLFEIEDGAFEWKLGVIYRLGLLEQKQRMAREEAFKLKSKKLYESQNRPSAPTLRTLSERTETGRPEARGRLRRKAANTSETRNRSPEVGGRSASHQPSLQDGNMRYDVDGASAFSNDAKLRTDRAWEKLQQLNAQSWKKRIDLGLRHQNRAMKDIRAMFWGVDEFPEGAEQTERILAIPQRPGLMALLVSDLNIMIDKPSFPLGDFAQFLHAVGKGMPLDMQYSLLIPMSLNISMGEVRMTLRDYPLPLLHVPAIKPGQSPRLPSLLLKTDFVIAEEHRDKESSRPVKIVIVPEQQLDSGEKIDGLTIEVRRTISPVKTYSNATIEINTGHATKITWGTSYQPAIQDMMQVMEGFSKPPVDPSERVGFWDKIRLLFHSKIHVSWKGGGDVHLALKGSRDPYMVTGQGAGFVMCWQNNVRWSIAQQNDSRKFMTVDSGDYILAIPDFSHYIRQNEAESAETDSMTSSSSHKRTASFRKVVMKLSGNVQWLAGLVFERNIGDGRRTFETKPHYEVIFKHPAYAKPVEGQPHDAFRGFRSHHIHVSLAIAAPVSRDWTVTNLKPSKNYNSVHLTPRFFSHFFSWWSLFSGQMALPIRQGKLWPGIEKSNKKFGRHVATIKYNLLLSPLFISHVYKHKDAEDYGHGVVSATGLKLRLNSFMLDLHQRREEYMTMVQGSKKSSKATRMRINEAQLDFISADIRAISASITGTNAGDLDRLTDETLEAYQQSMMPVDTSRFILPDNDTTWIDMDDFVELDWILPTEANPETRILPLAYAPRFTYFRQTDQSDILSQDMAGFSPFGNESTHYCVMSAGNDPRRVQCDLIERRLEKIAEQIEQNQRATGEQELRAIREPDGESKAKKRFEVLQKHSENLRRKQQFLQSMLASLLRRLETDSRTSSEEDRTEQQYADQPENLNTPIETLEVELQNTDSAPLADYIADFSNRFIVHNAQIKWNNALRNIILRYIHQNSQRRGFVYYMSRRAVKFIADILEEQKRARSQVQSSRQSTATQHKGPLSPQEDDVDTVQDRIEQLLNDARKFVDANDADAAEGTNQSSAGDVGDNISHEFVALNSYYFRLIAPQIQLQSDKDEKSAVLVAAKGMQLKVVQIMDKNRMTDDVSGLVQRRFSAAMDSLQIFVTSSRIFSTQDLHMYSGNRYGTSLGSSWPPWVPFEAMFEFENNPYGFHRVVQRTSASLRYDKYNTLRLKYNNDVSNAQHGRMPLNDDAENRIDRLWVDFPRLRAICDSPQYYAMYIIVLDLLLYSEPLEKIRSERLEKIILASDFSDLTGAPEMVMMLQERIRNLEEIKMRFQINEKYLDREGWKSRIGLDRELATCEDELFFMMKAITTSQRKGEDRAQGMQATGLLRWYLTASEIAWHLVRDRGEPLLEFQLKNAVYDRTDNNDGSNYNTVEIERIYGLNLLPDAIYPEMIAPYIEGSRSLSEPRDLKMLRVQWHMLEAIAGIPVMDQFEVNVFPLRVQLEREIGKRLFEYIFPGVGSTAFENSNFSPFMIKQVLPSGSGKDGIAEEAEVNGDVVLPVPELGPDHIPEPTGGAGALELRLQPTLTPPAPRSPDQRPTKPKLGHHSSSDHRPFRLFQHQSRLKSDYRRFIGESSRSSSGDNLGVMSRPSSIRTMSNRSGVNGNMDPDRAKKFISRRNSSKDQKQSKESRSDDLTQMLNRASNYMTLAYVKIPSMVLCLSYKGKGQHNFEDVHDLVFRMPTLEYRNKTWSNLDLALQLKRDVIKALISHLGAIVGNKFSHHRPNKQQTSRLREVANSSTVLSSLNSSPEISTTTSESTSIAERSPLDDADMSPRLSFASERGSNLSIPVSYSSSIHSGTGTTETGRSGMLDDGGLIMKDRSTAKAEADRDRDSIRQSLTRHLTSLSQKTISQAKDVAQAEAETSNGRPKSRGLWGKKLFNTSPNAR